MTEFQLLQKKLDEASEEARIEAVENDLRLRHNTFAATKDLLPYRNDAHIALICAMGNLLTAALSPG